MIEYTNIECSDRNNNLSVPHQIENEVHNQISHYVQ